MVSVIFAVSLLVASCRLTTADQVFYVIEPFENAIVYSILTEIPSAHSFDFTNDTYVGDEGISVPVPVIANLAADVNDTINQSDVDHSIALLGVGNKTNGSSVVNQAAPGHQHGNQNAMVPALDASNDTHHVSNRTLRSLSVPFDITNDTYIGIGALRFPLTDHVMNFGRITGSFSPSHNCIGATGFSIWYKFEVREEQENPHQTNTTLEFVLLDDSTCQDNSCSQHERYHSTKLALNSDGKWNEAFVPFNSNSWSQDRSSFQGDKVLNLDRIRGWAIVVRSNLGSDSRPVIIFDQLACIGPGELFGAALMTNSTFDEALDRGQLSIFIHDSVRSEEETKTLLNQGTLNVNYTAVQSFNWGGGIIYGHRPPENAYYNLSLATSISFDCLVRVRSSAPTRTALRLILEDGKACTDSQEQISTCKTRNPSVFEDFYSFYHGVLDSEGLNNQRVDLLGSPNSTSPFWLTGWSGAIDNQALDKATIVGYRFEISLLGGPDIGSNASGSLELSRLKADFSSISSDNLVGNQTGSEQGRYVVEPYLFTNSLDSFSDVFSYAHDCVNLCFQNDDCLHGALLATEYSNKCGITSSIDLPGELYLRGEKDKTKLFWKNTEDARGDYCSLCTCVQESATIDCRNRDLKILPKTFDREWLPQVLDLRDNPSLAIIGTGSLAGIETALRELRLPENAVYVSPETIRSASALSTIVFQNLSSERILNMLSKPNEDFNNICCTRSEPIHLLSPPKVYFCDDIRDMSLFGSDSALRHYERFADEEIVPFKEMKKSLVFLAQAAESPEYCAEFCRLFPECQAFQYDARFGLSEPKCVLLYKAGATVAEPGLFANAEKTLPGYTIGYPPRARHRIENATVVVSAHSLEASSENSFVVEYEVSLQSNPTCGAVWVEPKIVGRGQTWDVSITPRRVVLYDTETTTTVKVKISDHTDHDITLILGHDIQACDSAFTAFGDANKYNVLIRVVAPSSYVLLSSLIAAVATLALGAGIFFWLLHRHRLALADQAWKVSDADLRYDSPPQTLGQGTFGFVVAADWRGTQVAVKRVLPSILDGGSSMLLTSSCSGQPRIDRDVEAGAARLNTSQIVVRSSMRSQKSDMTRLKTDFISEMRIISKLRHPCITTVMGAVVSGEPKLVMELMHFGSLHSILHNKSMPLDGSIILPILRDIAQGMRFLHAGDPQVIHGDLKALNVLVDDRFRAKVADFGLSGKQSLLAISGTPFYMAPELLRGEASNSSETDVYSYGVLLYEVLSRKEPYEGEDAKTVLADIMDRNKKKCPPIPKVCPAPLASMMEECFCENPSLRPSYEEIDMRLRRFNADSVEPGETQWSAHFRKSARNEDLLFQVFPRHVAEALRDGREPEPDKRENVGVFFSDIVGFTTLSSSLSPAQVTDMLDRLYNRFDLLIDKYQIFKVDTIGDAFLCASNLVEDQPDDHIKRIAEFSIDAIQAAQDTPVNLENPLLGAVQIRCGFHVGPAIGRVVGTRAPKYSVFGDAVNIASRMESNSLPGKIQCSLLAAEILMAQAPEIPLASRGYINVKGKGAMQTYFVNEVGGCLVPPETPKSSTLELEKPREIVPKKRSRSRRALTLTPDQPRVGLLEKMSLSRRHLFNVNAAKSA